MTQSSFYADGEVLDAAVVESNDVPASIVPSQAPSGFYPDGTAYTELEQADSVLADVQAALAAALVAQAAAEAAAAESNAEAAAAHQAYLDALALLSTALLKANNLSDLTNTATARANLGLGNVDNTSDANKPVSTAQQTALNLKAPLDSPALTGTPTAPTAIAGTNTTQLATTAFVDAARVILVAADALKAPLASPALTGTPTAPTAAPGTNTTQLATTAFVDAARVILVAADALKAPLASPALTGTPTAPTAAAGTNTTQLATTAFVEAARVILAAAIAAKAAIASPTFTGTPSAPTAAPGTNTTQLATTAFVLANSSTGGVSSIAGNTGAFTLGTGLKNATNVLKLSPVGLAQSFGGRLTLASGKPVMTTDQVGRQNLYYAPLTGAYVPVRVSGAWDLYQYTSGSTDQVGLTLALAGSANWAVGTLHDVFAIVDSGTLKLATRLWDAGMFETETQIPNATAITTGTGATPWARTSAAFDGTLVQANTVAAKMIPSNVGLANYIGQDWGAGVTKTVSKFVLTSSSDTFVQNGGVAALQIVLDGSNDGTNWTHLGYYYLNSNTTVGLTFTIPVNTGNRAPYRYHRVGVTGDGTNSINIAELQFFEVTAPANGRRLTLMDGILVNDASMTARTGASTTVTTPQYEGSYLGTIRIDAATAGQITAHNSYGPSRVYNVWNAYNQRNIILKAGVITPNVSSYVLTAKLWQIAQTGFSLDVLQGIAGDHIGVTLLRSFYLNGAAGHTMYEAGIAVDNTVSFSGVQLGATIDNTADSAPYVAPRLSYSQTAAVDLPPFAGVKTLNAIERTDAGPGVCSPFVEQRSTQLRAEWMG